MKTVKNFYSILLCGLVVLAAGCTKDKDNPDPTFDLPSISIDPESYEGKTGDVASTSVTVLADAGLQSLTIYKEVDGTEDDTPYSLIEGEGQTEFTYDFEYTLAAGEQEVIFSFVATDSLGENAAAFFTVTKSELPAPPTISIESDVYPNNTFEGPIGSNVSFDVDIKTPGRFSQLRIRKTIDGEDIESEEIVQDENADTELLYPFSYTIPDDPQYADVTIMLTFIAFDMEGQEATDQFTIIVDPLVVGPNIKISDEYLNQFPDFDYVGFPQESINPSFTIEDESGIKSITITRSIDGVLDNMYNIFIDKNDIAYQDYFIDANTFKSGDIVTHEVNEVTGTVITYHILAENDNMLSSDQDFEIEIGINLQNNSLIIPINQGTSNTFFSSTDGVVHTKMNIDDQDENGQESLSPEIDFGYFYNDINDPVYGIYGPNAYPGKPQGGYEFDVWESINTTFFVETNLTMDDLRIKEAEMVTFIQSQFENGTPTEAATNLAAEKIILFKTDPAKPGGSKYGILKMILIEPDFQVSFEYWSEE